MTAPKDDYLIRPDPLDPRLTERVAGIDQTGQAIETRVTVERALTIFLNAQEIVTAMTINDYPEYLALGYLLNQHMLLPDDVVTGVDYDEELAVVVVRTKRKTDYEKKLKKKVQTSGCAQGTVFGDLMEALENVTLPQAELRTSWLYALTHKINTTPSLYLEAGAIHGCVLAQEDKPLIYMEDVGRHNAVDKIAGCMFKHACRPHDKIFYTTGRLTSEMVIKTVRMGIPILVSRSGFTAWGVELARKANLTLVGRARGKRFVALAGEERIVFDQDLPSSRRRARSIGARRRCTMIEHPPMLGLVLAGGLARRMGGGDKARIRIGGRSILERVLARIKPQCTRRHPQRQRRSRALRRYRPAGRGRHGARFRRPARRHPGRARLGGGACARDRRGRERSRRLSVSARAIWSRGCRRRGAQPACRSPARARASGAIPWSVCGRWRCATTCAPRCWRRTCTRSRPGRRATASPSPTGRRRRSIPSSTSTRPPTPPKPSVSRRSNATFEPLIPVARQTHNCSKMTTMNGEGSPCPHSSSLALPPP